MTVYACACGCVNGVLFVIVVAVYIHTVSVFTCVFM